MPVPVADLLSRLNVSPGTALLALAAVTLYVAYLPAFLFYVMNWGIFFYTWVQPELAERAWEPARMYGIHFWSLCVEEQFYLVFPLLFSFMRHGRTRLRWLLALWIASIGFRVLCAAFLPKAAYGLIPLVCGEYLIAGAVGAVVFAEDSATAAWLRAAARRWMFPLGLSAVVALFALFAPAAPSIDHVMHPPHTQTLLALGFLAMVLGLWQTDNRWVLRFFNFAPFRFLGRISYGLYLLHRIPFDAVKGRALGPPALVFAVALAATYLLASASWYLFERPFLRLKRFFQPRGRGRDPSASASFATSLP